MNRHGIVFDLDGTLIDSAADIADVLNAMLDKRGNPPVAVDIVKPLVSLGARDILARVFGPQDPAENDRLMTEFQSTYRAQPPDPSRLFPGVLPMLETLRGEGYALGICTNKPEDNARRIVAAIGLAERIDVLIGRREGMPAKPNPAPLFEALRQMNAPRETALYVGDNEVDAETAIAANIPFILVSFGYPTGSLNAIASQARLDHFDQFPPLARSFKNAGA